VKNVDSKSPNPRSAIVFETVCVALMVLTTLSLIALVVLSA
jgi:hypothetical protein